MPKTVSKQGSDAIYCIAFIIRQNYRRSRSGTEIYTTTINEGDTWNFKF